MRKIDQKQRQGGGGGGGRIGNNNGFIPSSFRSLSSYLRIVSSGASTVASTVRSAASAASTVVDRDNDAVPDQVLWAGFDTLECEGDVSRRVLLLGYQFGFQVWDVEDANNVRNIVSRNDGAVFSMQLLPKPTVSKGSHVEYANSRPLLVICADGSFSTGNGNIKSSHDQVTGGSMPTVVWFYSLKSQSYIKELKFRSAVYSVRCSSRIVAVLQAAQVHCVNVATLQRDYTILTNPIVTSSSRIENIGLGPLALGPRWIAYSGSLVALPNARVSPQHLTHSKTISTPASNGSLVAHYAKQSSKQLAVGIVTLGDIGYKKLSRYYSDFLPDGNISHQVTDPTWKDGCLPDAENVGMVIVKDVVSKSVITQFKAHDSPIASLSFDPSGTLLVTASVHGHNFNIFHIIPTHSSNSSGSENSKSYTHLYKLQRGFTNAVIQDISFSIDSHWIIISSSRGTTHLFSLSPPSTQDLGLPGQQQQSHGFPVTLSALGRIKNGSNGWRTVVGGAAAAAAAASGRTTSSSGVIASTFYKCKSGAPGAMSSAKYHMLVFSSSGCVTQYALRLESGSYESFSDNDSRLLIEPIQKWNICHKINRQREENVDIYGENGHVDNRKVFPERTGSGNSVFFEVKKVNSSAEERNHVFISEAELQMHESRTPLWARARPQIYFESFCDVTDLDKNIKGEVEIEKISSYTVEGRSRYLVPVGHKVESPPGGEEEDTNGVVNTGVDNRSEDVNRDNNYVL